MLACPLSPLMPPQSSGHATDLLPLGDVHPPPVDDGQQDVGQHEEQQLTVDKFVKGPLIMHKVAHWG